MFPSFCLSVRKLIRLIQVSAVVSQYVTNKSFLGRIPCGLAVWTPVSRASDRRFEPSREPTTPGESCGSSTVQWSFWEDNTRWVPCTDGIKLQSLRSVRFWTSLVRNCLNFQSNRTLLRHIGDCPSFLAEPGLTLVCRVSYTTQQACFQMWGAIHTCTKPY